MRGRRVVLGVSGGVAAYKSAYLARALIESGAEVRAVMTQSATHFLGPATLAALTGCPPVVDLFTDESVSPHTDLAKWMEAMVVAPATLNALSRIAHAVSGDALSTTALATRAPLVLAPAMHTEMWEQPATERVMQLLQADGRTIVWPVEGELAGGDHGMGRMAEPEQILAAVGGVFEGPMSGRRVLVTAGGTREPIDPVRYLGNRSSGKMGHAVADEARRRGAEVVLVTAGSAPVPPGVEVVRVDTAQEMAREAWSAAENVDVAVLAAAVADFRSKRPVDVKLKRKDGVPDIVLEPTPNILAGLVERRPRPYLVGFAAETGSLEGARTKAAAYGADLMVANDVAAFGSGFGTDTNQVTILFPDGTEEAWPLMPKQEVASRLWDLVCDRVS